MNYAGLLAGVALFAVVGWAQNDLPEGKGKATVERICVGCHEVDTVTGSRRTEEGWKEVVGDMTSRGAAASDAETAEIVAYLSKNFGKINVNTASAQQLQGFLGLSEKEAQAIVRYRADKGRIKDFEQLKTVPGLDAAKLQEKRNLIAFAQ